MNSDFASIRERLSVIVAEITAMAGFLDDAELTALARAMITAGCVFFSGQGRSGLMIRAIAIRLMHIGLNVHVAGEPSAPSIGKDDLLVAVSGSARTPITLNHIAAARKAGAKVALVTTVEAGPDCDLSVRIPVRTQISTVQHAGSLFEQSLLLIGDAIAWYVQKELGVADGVLNQRHANLQ